MASRRGALMVWALYDLANTFFAVAMLSFYFPLWITEDRGAKELAFSGALSFSMLCVAAAMPLCGAISDATDSRVRYLRWTTLGCVLATLLIGFTHHLGVALGLFILANVCYQLGTIFYDAMLWRVATPDTLGQASGLGAAFGYLGSMAGLLLLSPFVARGGHHAAFVPSAVYFLVFALPLFAWLREPASRPVTSWRALLRDALLRVATTLRAARQQPAFFRFLIASFFALNAINTVLVFMVVYTKTVLGFTEGDVIRFFLVGQASAVVGSLTLGKAATRFGAKRTLAWIWTGWLAALMLLGLNGRREVIWICGPIIGACLGSTWATSRVLVLELAPKDRVAEMFGLAGLLGRSASILGPLVWGLIVLDPSRYQHAVGALVALLLVGLWIFRKVPNTRPSLA